MCSFVGVACRLLMTLNANAISSLVHMQRKFIDPRMAHKVLCYDGD
jgi:hypothetical protein